LYDRSARKEAEFHLAESDEKSPAEIFDAVVRGDLDGIDDWKQSDVDSIPARGGQNLYHAAAQNGSPEIIKRIDQRYTDEWGKRPETGHPFSPVHVASQYGHLDAIECLVSLGFDVESYDKKRKIPLVYALEYNQSAAAELLFRLSPWPERLLRYAMRWANVELAWWVIEKYDRNIAELTGAIRQNPHDAVPLRNRGLALQARGNLELAIIDLTEAIRLDPGDAITFGNRGVVYSELGSFSAAISDYSEAIRLNPDIATLYWNRSNALDAVGEEGRSRVDRDELKRLNFSSPHPIFNMYGIRIRTSEASRVLYSEAIDALTEELRLSPANANALLARGLAYDAQRCYRGPNSERNRAMADYADAIKLDPKCASFFMYDWRNEKIDFCDATDAIRLDSSYGNLLLRLGSDESYEFCYRLAHFTEATHVMPNVAEPFRKRGDLLMEFPFLSDETEGELFGKAIADYTQALNIEPDDVRTLLNRGRCYEQQSDLDRAIADFSAAIRLNPKDGLTRSVRFARARAYQARGNLGLAIDDLTRLIELNPKRSQPFFLRGSAYQAAGELDLALIDFKEFQRQKPTNDAAARLVLDLERKVAERG
jgi:tetratricopeptide (TPR) repeat protein